MGRIAASQKRRYLSQKRKKNRGHYLALFRQMKIMGNKTVEESIRSTVAEQDSATPSTSCPLTPPIIPQKLFSSGLILEASDGEKNDEFHLEGMRTVNLQYMICKFAEIDRHNLPMDCRFSNLILTGEYLNDLDWIFAFKCSKCNGEFKVSSDDPQSKKKLADQAAALGSITSSCGYSQFEETMATLDVPVMERKPFIKLEQDITLIEEAEWKMTREAAEEEERLAVELGDVCRDDVLPIPVACDTSCSKKSYGSNYNYLSGSVMSSAVDDVKRVLTKCNDGVPPDDDLVRDFMLSLPREKEKCLYACSAKEIGGIVDGKMDVEAVYGMIKLFHPDKPILIQKGKPVLEQCNADVKVEEDECEYVFKIATCIKEGRDKLLSSEK